MPARTIGRTAVAAILLIACWPAAAQATFPGQNGKIAVFAVSAAGQGVHLLNADGTGLELVVPNGTDPAWSADGSRLAYVGGPLPDTLMIAAADGSGQTVLRTGAGSFDGSVSRNEIFREPAWSPGGDAIAYEEVVFACAPRVGCFDLPEGVRTVRPDGSDDHRLLPVASADPAYSPDGTKIAWNYDIWVGSGVHLSNADGSGDTPLTVTDPNTGNGAAFDPSWSPDGSRIAFTSYVNQSNPEIFVMNGDGSGKLRLTFTEADDVDPAWSPDGQRIAWTRDRRLWMMNADGGDQSPVAELLAFRPDWQPLPGPRREDFRNASHFCKALSEFLGGAEFTRRYRNHGGCVSREVARSR